MDAHCSMRNLIFILLFTFSFQTIGQIGGQTSFDFLTVNDNARIAALGGENISTKDGDPNLFNYNPALLNDSMKNFFSINYMPFYADVKKTSFGYVFSHKKTGQWGVNFQYLDYGTLYSTDASGNDLGEFNAGDWAFTVGKSHTLDKITLGANLKFAGSNIMSYSAIATLLDIGGVWEHPKKDFKISLLFKNMGLVLKEFTPSSQSRTPFDIQAGFSYKLEHMPLRFSLTLHHLYAFDITYLDPLRQTKFDEDGNEVPEQKTFFDNMARHMVFGGEFVMSRNFHLRFGYNYLRRQELRIENKSGGAGFSFGLMMRIKAFELNFTRAYYHVVGGTTMLTLTSNLSRILGRKVIRKNTED